MAEVVDQPPKGYKIWKNPSRRGEPVAYLGEFYPPAGCFYFSPKDLCELGFSPGEYTILAPEDRPFTNLISKWQTVTVPAHDVATAEVQAASWGIPLRDWMELHVRVFGNLDPFGHPDLDDEPDEEWRGQVAQVLIEQQLVSKANRFVECSRYAHLYKCKGPEQHDLFSPIYCDLRFCPRCAPRQFASPHRKIRTCYQCRRRTAEARLQIPGIDAHHSEHR